jgi:limonene-1,2-epoxide hydrolase
MSHKEDTKCNDKPKSPSRRAIMASGAALVSLTAAGCVSSSSNSRQGTENSIPETAQKAFQHFSQGVATGEWKPLIDMLANDCNVWLPVSRFRNSNTGKNAATAYFQFVSQELQVRAKVTPISVTINGNTVCYEFRVEGTAAGKPTNTQNTVFFEVDGEQVSSFREYFGN